MTAAHGDADLRPLSWSQCSPSLWQPPFHARSRQAIRPIPP